MNHYMDSDPHLIHQRTEEMVRKVNLCASKQGCSTSKMTKRGRRRGQ